MEGDTVIIFGKGGNVDERRKGREEEGKRGRGN